MPQTESFSEWVILVRFRAVADALRGCPTRNLSDVKEFATTLPRLIAALYSLLLRGLIYLEGLLLPSAPNLG